MRKIIVLIILVLLTYIDTFGQGYLSSYRSKDSKVVGISLSKGENNIGATGVFGYHVIDKFSINLNGGFRKFTLRDYSENITEVGLEGIYMVYDINERYLRSNLFSGFNVSLGFGVTTEFVTNTSDIILAEDYPQLYYGTAALYVETSIYENLKIVAHFKQWYAINSKDDIIGKNRYDLGLGLRYYFN